jgi:hypothetical protein
MPSRPRSSTGTRTGPRGRQDAHAQPTKASAEHPSQNTVTLAGLKLPLPAMPAAGSKRVLWWGGLAALAVVGVIEWPVAVVVGAGSYVAERLTREDVRHDLAGQD